MLRAPLLLVHLLYGLALTAWIGLDRGVGRRRELLAQAWSRRLLAILGIELRVEGAPLAGAHLTVANHVSWLDIPVLGALEPTRFVSKSEVRDWPLAGWLARAAGTFFLRRSHGGSAALLERLVPHLRAQGTVVIFPEGTTTDGSEIRPFHARLFGAALEAKVPVQAVTLRYGLSCRGENIAPFIGDDSLVGHLVRLLREPALHVRVLYGPPIHGAASRDALAQEAEAYVRAALPPPETAAARGLDPALSAA